MMKNDKPGIVILDYSTQKLMILIISDEELEVIRTYPSISEYLWEKDEIKNINLDCCDYMWVDNVDQFIKTINFIKL